MKNVTLSIHVYLNPLQWFQLPNYSKAEFQLKKNEIAVTHTTNFFFIGFGCAYIVIV